MKISELKKEARLNLQGKWGKVILISVIYSLFSVLLSSIGNIINNSVLSCIYSLIVLIVDVPFAYGFVASLLKLYRGEDVNPLDFITIGLQAFQKSWSVVLHIFLKLIVPIILLVVATIIAVVSIVSTVISSTSLSGLTLICVILIICLYIYLLIKSLSYVLTSFILYDEQNLSGKEIVEKSQKLMKGNKGKYVLLFLSFILYFLALGVIFAIVSAIGGTIAASVVAFIAYIFLEIYINFTVLAFYSDLISEEPMSTAKQESEPQEQETKKDDDINQN